MAGRDITEGSGTFAIAVDVGVTSSTSIWQNVDMSYDVAIGGLPFIYAIADARPYTRQTAPFRKEQFDNGAEPGEQSLTGWWIRSQMSFHSGTGIKFFDPATTDENGHYRFADSKGIDVWTKGQATLLSSCFPGHITTGAVQTNKRKFQTLRSIEYNGTKGVLMADEYDVDKIDMDGNEIHFINYNIGTSSAVLALCDDGVTAFWLTNYTSGGVTKKTVFGKPLIGSSASTADEFKIGDATGSATNAVMEYVKERIILCMDNGIYEIPAVAGTNLPTAVYTHPTTNHLYTSITASGAAIYVAGYTGIQSSIQKFTLTTAGVMPTLTQAVVAAEMPVGEIIHCIKYYLGYMMIGTSKGIRAAVVSDTDGSINYGPLIVETSQPVYDFACRDHYVWAASSVDGEPGTIRVDLGNELETLRFAYANDIYYGGITGHQTTACAFVDGTDQLAFTSASKIAGTRVTNKAKTSGIVTLTTLTDHELTTGDVVWVEGLLAVGGSNFNSTTDPFVIASTPTTTTFTYTLAGADVASTAVTATNARVALPGNVFVESATELVTSGYLTTGNIRYGTLEPKNFKRLLGRGDFTKGSMTLETVTADGTEYDHISYDASVPSIEVGTSNPATAQEYVAYKFLLYRDATYPNLGPIFKGYQAKATIATPRQRIIQFPVYCYDVETDKYNTLVGYEGRAFAKIQALEDIEESGDVLTWQDLTTGESRQAIIEQISFTRMTPPDKRFDGFGGVINIIVRTV